MSIFPTFAQLESAIATGDLDGTGTDDFVLSDGMGLVQAYSSSGAMLWSASGALPADRLGFKLAASPDVNGDGASDVMAISLPAITATVFDPCTFMTANVYSPGYVRMLSGADGSTVWTATRGPSNGSRPAALGASLASIGDQNGDGIADVAATQFGYTQFQNCSIINVPGTLWVLSGVDGSTIRSHVAAPGDLWPEAVVAAGDLDGDGVEDYAVAGGSSLSLTTYSGQNGNLIWTRSIPPLGPNQDLQDLTAVPGCDGRSDLVLQTEHWISASTTGIGARLFDGNTGTQSWTYTGVRSGYQMQKAASVADADGDGVPDVAVCGGPGVQVLSGATGALLPGTLMSGVISAMGSAPDYDGDGDGEVLVARFYGPPEMQLIAVGNPSPLATFVPIGNGCGSGATPPFLSVSVAPTLGSSFVLSYENGQAGAQAAIVFGLPISSPLVLGSGCEIWLDLQSPVSELLNAPLPATGATGIPVSLPGICQLLGTQLRLQGYAFPTPTPSGFEFTSGYEVTLGF